MESTSDSPQPEFNRGVDRERARKMKEELETRTTSRAKHPPELPTHHIFFQPGSQFRYSNSGFRCWRSSSKSFPSETFAHFLKEYTFRTAEDGRTPALPNRPLPFMLIARSANTLKNKKQQTLLIGWGRAG
jgi:hypothetical protein